MTNRRPQAFSLKDPSLKIDPMDEPPVDEPIAVGDVLEDEEVLSSHRAPARRSNVRRFAWGSLLLASVGGLVSLALGLWVTSFVEGLFSRNDWIGYSALALFGIAVLAALMLIWREVFGFMRLGRITRLKQKSEIAVANGSLEETRHVVRSLKTLYRGRADMKWGMSRLSQQERDVLDAKDLAVLAERELLLRLDGQAKSLIAQSARRVSVVTAISPAPVVDVLYVAVENMKLLHRLATLYGGRPGATGVFKLARMVIAHLTLTGGLALTSDFLSQLVGQRLTAKLSARLGEGIFNGALVARIGMAAIHICRPLPFVEARPPRFRDFLGELTRIRSRDKDADQAE